jgi:hypothetical protein
MPAPLRFTLAVVLSFVHPSHDPAFLLKNSSSGIPCPPTSSTRASFQKNLDNSTNITQWLNKFTQSYIKRKKRLALGLFIALDRYF